MPKIAFSLTSVRPKVELIPDDYFYSPSPGDLPDVPDLPNGIEDQATDLVDRFLPNIGDISRVPTLVDTAGCDIGQRAALGAARLNRTQQTDYDLEDLATEVMDNQVDGFLVVYNNVVESYANAIYMLAPVFFTPGTPDYREYLNNQYTLHKRRLNGEVRGFNAILACALAVAYTNAHLDAPPFPDIVRQGKVPADFAR
ncbi:MAG: hypothetical protein AAFN94_01565 [Pseudomonadota bacterium]